MDDPLVNSLERIALDIARDYFGHDARSSERFGQGVMNHMFRVRGAADDLCVVRLYPAGREKVADYEPQLIETLHERGCAVPQVIGYGRGDGAARPAHMAYRYVHGEPLANCRHRLTAAQLRGLGSRIAENLQIMAGYEVRGFGGLLTSVSADDPSAWEFFRRSLVRGIDAARAGGLLDVVVIDELQAVLDSAHEDVAAFDGALGWGDLAPSNILVDDDGALAGLVDFESCLALDRALSVGYFFAIAPSDPLLGILVEECRSLGFELDDRRTKLCAVLRAARMARFAHTALPSGVAQRPVAAVLPGAITALAELART